MTETRSVFFELHERLQHAIVHRLRWRELRPVQEQTVAAVRKGQNAIVLAPTAGGKTEASMFGVLDGLLRERPEGLFALYLSPLRALLNNQEPRLHQLTRMVGYDAFKWHGDVSAQDKARFIASPCAVLMTTPESLEVILMTERFDQQKLFASLRYVIIDEIHGFAGDDRGDHLLTLLERLTAYCSQDLQRIGLSATVGNPEQLLEWVQGSSQRPGAVVNPGGPRQKKVIEILPLPEGMAADSTAALLARGKKSLLFADSRSKVEKMKAGLERSGIRAFPHHGSLSRSLREESEEAFRSGRNCSIICTSTMELGLDVGDLDIVLQLGAPSTVSAFMQRLGRTGRRPGTTARMTFLCDKPENFLVACALVSLALKGWVEPVVPTRASYPVYVHQVLATILSQAGATRKALLDGVGAPYCFSELGRDEREQILDEMLAQEVLITCDSLLQLGPEGERRFGRSNFMTLYSVFDTPSILSVRTQDNREIGQLESWFVQSSDESLCFLLGGRPWQSVRIDWKRHTLFVKPARGGAVPTWMGEPTLYSRELCQQVRDLLTGRDEPVFLGERGQRFLNRLRGEWSDLIGSRNFTYAREGERHLVLYTFAGGRVNNVLARFHQMRTGQAVTVHNFHIKTAISRTGSYWSELQESLELLADEPLSDQMLSSMLKGLQRTRLSKFQACLPPELEARFLCSRLFDAEQTRQQCRNFVRVVTEPAPSVVRESGPAYQAVISQSDDPFVAQLARLAAREPTANKWVFVPSSRMKNMLGERLCLQGTDWLNFRFVTPFELALEVAAPEMLARGVDPKPEGLGPPLMLQLLRLLPEGEAQHFAPLLAQPHVPETLWRSIWELRMAGVSPLSLPRDTPKQQELAALYDAYVDHLARNGLGDRATILEVALSLEGHSPTREGDLLLEAPSVLWSPLERRWLDSLQGTRCLTNCDPTGALPRRFPLLCPHREPLRRPVTRGRHLLRALNASGECERAEDDTLSLFFAGRRDAEVQEILRRIIRGSVPLDKVELVAADPDSVPLLLDKFAQAGIEATFGAGVPALNTRYGQVLSGLLDWLSSDFSAYSFRRVLLSGAYDVEGVGGAQAAAHLARSGARWGRETYDNYLGPEQSRLSSFGYHERAESVGHLRAWIQDLLGRVPRSDGAVGMSELAGCLVDLLELSRKRHVPLEQSALRILRNALLEMEQLRGLELPWKEALRQIRERLDGLRCGSGRPSPGHLYVSALEEAGLSGREHVFVFGLDEGVCPTRLPEDPVLDDQERQSLHPGLVTSLDRAEEANFRLLERLGQLDGKVTLSYSCQDLASGEEVMPSWIFYAAARRLYPDLSGYEELTRVLGPAVGLVCDSSSAASEGEWWLARLQTHGPAASTAALEGFPWLSRGSQAELRRLGESFTCYDGLVTGLAGKLDPRLTGQAVSVSRLQDLADCAFRTYLKSGLGLKALELEPPDPGLWLDAMQRGTLLHDTFADFYRELRRWGRSVASDDLSLLQNALERVLAQLKPQLPPASPALVAAEMDSLHHDLKSFLALELASAEREPIGFEVGFGLPELFDEEMAREEPVVLRLADDVSFPLRGRIDRIDRVREGLEVVDYKTGHSLARKTGVKYDQGRLVQHALYSLVVEQLSGQSVVSTSYYFPTAGAPRAWLTFPRPDEHDLAMLLRDLLEPLRAGVFPQAESVGTSCKYCDFRRACPGHDKERIKAKLEAANPNLQWRRRLDDRP